MQFSPFAALRVGPKRFLKLSVTVLVALPQTTSFFIGCSPIRYDHSNSNNNSNRRRPCSPYGSSTINRSNRGCTSEGCPHDCDDLHRNRRGISACASFGRLERSRVGWRGGVRERAGVTAATATTTAAAASLDLVEKKKRSARLPEDHLLLPAFQELESALTGYV